MANAETKKLIEFELIADGIGHEFEPSMWRPNFEEWYFNDCLEFSKCESDDLILEVLQSELRQENLIENNISLILK